jgi:hypothetical protein
MTEIQGRLRMMPLSRFAEKFPDVEPGLIGLFDHEIGGVVHIMGYTDDHGRTFEKIAMVNFGAAIGARAYHQVKDSIEKYGVTGLNEVRDGMEKFLHDPLLPLHQRRLDALDWFMEHSDSLLILRFKPVDMGG